MQSPSADAAMVTVLMKGWRVSSTVKANKRTHQRAHWSGQPVCGVRTGSRSHRLPGRTRGPASDVPVGHDGALDVLAEQTRVVVDFGLSGPATRNFSSVPAGGKIETYNEAVRRREDSVSSCDSNSSLLS